MRNFAFVLSALFALGSAGAALAADPSFSRSERRAACAAHDPQRRPFFGDTHVHTAYSLDANLGGTRDTPRDAYRFAQGEVIGLPPYDASGKPLRTAKLRRPLDFTAVTDHAEPLGEIADLLARPACPATTRTCAAACRTLGPIAVPMFLVIALVPGARRFRPVLRRAGPRCLEQAGVVWQDIQAAAEEFYDRTAACTFTTLRRLRVDAARRRGANLHRNVDLPERRRAGAAHQLHRAARRRRSSGRAPEPVPRRATRAATSLAIPHNSNLSGPATCSSRPRLARRRAPPDRRERPRWRQRWSRWSRSNAAQGRLASAARRATPTDEVCGFEKLPDNASPESGASAARPAEPVRRRIGSRWCATR